MAASLVGQGIAIFNSIRDGIGQPETFDDEADDDDARPAITDGQEAG